MDIFLSLVMGVSVRFALDGVSQLRPVIIGVWEGLCLHRLTTNKQGPDPYLAYLLRLVIDVFVVQSIAPVMLSVLWSVLVLLVLAAARHGNDTIPRREPRTHRIRHSRPATESRRQSILATPPRMEMPALFSPRSPNAPPSPPSSFLNGDTDMAASPAQMHSHLPTPPETLSLDGSSGPQHIVMPMLPSDTSEDELLDAYENGLLMPPSTPSVRRLSTVPEESTVQETPPLTIPEIRGESIEEQPAVISAKHSPPSSPLPIPDVNEIDSPEHTPTLIPPILLPLPEDFQLPPLLLPEGRSASPPHSDPDPLLTPRNYNEELADETDYDELDELKTPPPKRRPLSPLLLTLAPELEPESDAMDASREIAATKSILQNLDRIMRAEIAAGTSRSSSNTPIPIPAPGPSTQDDALEIMSVGQMTPSEADSVITNTNALAIESKAVELRAEAWKASQELTRLQGELQQAQRRKRPKDAFLIKAEISDLTKKVEKMHKSAEKRFLKARNMTAQHDVPTVDVHGLLIQEAIRVTEAEFRKALLAGQTSIRVVTGKGKHSKDGVAKLKPAIIEHMSKQQFVCRLETRNSGVVVLSCP